MNKDQIKVLVTGDYTDLEVRVMGHLLESKQVEVDRLAGTVRILSLHPLTPGGALDIAAGYSLTAVPPDPKPRARNQPWYRQFDKRRP